MRSSFLTVALLLLTFLASAQCVPDTTVTSSGIYPDSAANFAVAYVGQPYEQVVTAVVPADTCVVIIPLNPCQTVPIDSILITSVTGLPPNFTYECQQPNCAFYGGSSGCMRIFSTSNPVSADTGVYDLQFTLVTYSIIQQTNTVSYYSIQVVDTTTLNVKEYASSELELKQNSPNPVSAFTNIEFNSGQVTHVTFEVVNMIGVSVHEETLLAKRGSNTIRFDASKLKSGVYFYILNDGKRSYSKRMLVR